MSTVVITVAITVGVVWTGVAVVLGVIAGRAIRLAEERRPRP